MIFPNTVIPITASIEAITGYHYGTIKPLTSEERTAALGEAGTGLIASVLTTGVGKALAGRLKLRIPDDPVMMQGSSSPAARAVAADIGDNITFAAALAAENEHNPNAGPATVIPAFYESMAETAETLSLTLHGKQRPRYHANWCSHVGGADRTTRAHAAETGSRSRIEPGRTCPYHCGLPRFSR